MIEKEFLLIEHQQPGSYNVEEIKLYFKIYAKTLEKTQIDNSYIKLLLENQPSVSNMTDEQLELEKERLLKLLKNNGKEK